MSRTPRQTAAFSLFTFLDVMLCTLGALIIVLICVVRTAQIKNADAPPENVAELEEIESARQTAAWSAKQLAAARDKTRQQLQDRRLELSHIEDHSRRLQAQLAELEATAAKSGDARQQEKIAALRSETQRLTAAAAAAEEELQRARDEAGTKRATYAIVPYEGPNGTSRRPLYIECRADSIVLQPENIVLTDRDLAGPLVPGNPLAAGLRAAREYLSQGYSFDEADGGEPYPLLLVRPDGINAYYVARAAMSSWGSEFGYEFIDQDWKLEFRPPQPGMVDAMRVAVDEARVRQRALARAAPRFYAENEQEWYRASPSGGVVREGGSGRGSGRGYRRSGRSGENNGEFASSGGRYGSGGTQTAGYRDGANSRGAGTGRDGGGNYPSNGTAQTDSNENLAAIYGAVADAPPTDARGANRGAGGGLGASVAGGGTGTGTSPNNGAPGGSGPGGLPGDSLAGGAGSSTAGASPYFAGTAYGNAAGAPGGNPGGLAAGQQNPGGNNAFSGGTGGNLAGTAAGADGPSLVGGAGNSATPAGVAVNASGRGAAGNPAAGTGFGGSANTASTGAGGAKETSAADAYAAASAGGTVGRADASAQSSGAGGSENGTDANGASGATDVAAAASTDKQGKASAGQAGGGRAGNGTQAGGSAAAGTEQAAGQGNSGAKGSASGKPGSRYAMGGASSGSGAPTPAGATPVQIGNSSAQASATNDPTNQSLQVGTSTINVGSSQSATNSMADRRGKNWSLPEEARNAVPLTRPVRVECSADKLVLRSEHAPSQTREIPMSQYTETSVEDLVTAVWKHVDTWGPAGHGMYWRPVLSVDVAPGAEGRFADLQTLLADSGLDVKAAAKQAAPVARPQRKLGLW